MKEGITYINVACCVGKIEILFLSDEGPTLETLDYTIRIGSTPTFLYFDLYLYSAYTAHHAGLYKPYYSLLEVIDILTNLFPQRFERTVK